MSDIHEADAVEQVCLRLVDRFPTIPLATVRATVQDVHANLNGPVRNYVAVLVERGAAERLSAIVTDPRPPQVR